MRQINVFSDKRLMDSCVYCGGFPGTRDHVPSQIMLDEPLPDNLPVVPACRQCNESFSMDEEYVACLLEVVIIGSTSITPQMRPKVQGVLANRHSLSARVDASRIITPDGLLWQPELERVENVMLKLARSHAAFELGVSNLEIPDCVFIVPAALMTSEMIEDFELMTSGMLWPEVGSRAFQRMAVNDPEMIGGWIVVQPGRYRYLTSINPGVTVRIVLSEYLACEVRWS